MKEILNEFINSSIKKLQDAQLALNSSQIKTIEIGAEYFNEKFLADEDVTQLNEEFSFLRNQNKPTLYWFELMNNTYNIELRRHYEEYRERTKKGEAIYRNTSSYKTKPDYSSKILYVGKVEKAFWGRLVTHLGYNVSEKTAGMQLYHWYNPTIYGKIVLNYIEFDHEMKHLIVILEKQLAKKLKPLIGRY
ncbi:hypothetical protein ACOSP6_01725 [Tenacibaculum sp. MEBiC06402]|uniref:hypothetical protein n=1 Tax=unclassified Tenacibaculum TaxID=2635139 RepID=UPI003B998380